METQAAALSGRRCVVNEARRSKWLLIAESLRLAMT
jgi:hypothetical protein